MFPDINGIETPAFASLQQHAETWKTQHMRALFDQDPTRFDRFSFHQEGMLVDFSKHMITDETLTLLTDLAASCQLKEAMDALFSGEPVNRTENRAVLHTALRDQSDRMVVVDGEDVKPAIRQVLEKMRLFCNEIHAGIRTGADGRSYTDVVNIGIGGSDLGPAMVCEALKPFHKKGIRVHFVSNVDATHLVECVQDLDPATTLFIIASKTFTTQETMTNARSAKQWFLESGMQEEDIARHFVAVSTALQEAQAFGIDPDNIFGFWDWVGGRFSLWSAIGLSIMLAIGADGFDSLLNGAYAVDEHVRTAPLNKNIPVIMGLLGWWYNQFFEARTHAVLPYDQYLEKFPAYLQQADMESNGKRIDRRGKEVSYPTGPVVWGAPGTNGQHAFYQLIHQGTQLIPCDFIVPARSQNPLGDHHAILLSHCLAQSEAMMKGKTAEEVREELEHSGMTEEEIQFQLPYRVFPGNIPSTTIIVPECNAFQLGQLIALYEHKIFVQGVLWNVFSFDQWGVELGKKLAAKILPEISGRKEPSGHDGSTIGLINEVLRLRS